MTISRRGMLLAPLGLAAASKASGQAFTYDSQLNVAVVNFTVTDRAGRQILGLRPSEIRVFEDDVPQSIAIFAESGKPAVAVGELTEPGLSARQFDAMREPESYTVAYRPSAIDQPAAFRKIRIGVVRAESGSWRVKHRAGYQR